MNYKKYQELAQRTCVDLKNDLDNINHMASGIITELGEIMDLYKKELAYKKPLDINHLKEEIGDVIWYVANLHTFLKKEFVFVQKQQIEQINNPIELLWKTIKDIKINPFNLDELNQPILSMIANLQITEQELFEIFDTNIKKLQIRYPDKFDTDKALNRDLDAENKILNKNEKI